MVENDTLSYHLNKPMSEHQAAVHSLITQERTQKLELLIHLLTNLTQPLVVCGPEGIGKTTLLSVLQERQIKSWQYCSIKGSADLSFEAIQAQLAKALSQDKSEKYTQALPPLLAQIESRKRKIVLIIDDAGALVPGLITSLIQYAAAHTVLRLIFVLTHDELHVQSRSDHAIEECHFIEIPPLSEKQCGEFLLQLSTRPNLQLSFNAISDNMIETIYRETHGIPGRIIAELPQIKVAKQIDSSKWQLPVAVLALVIVALAVQWFSARQISKKEAITPTAVEQQNTIDVAPSLATDLTGQAEPDKLELSVPSVIENALEPSDELTLDMVTTIKPDAPKKLANEQDIEKPGPVAEVKPVVIEKETANQPDLTQANEETLQPKPENKENTSKTQQTAEDAVVPKEQQVPQGEGWQWLSTQPANNYSLQLMVLSKQQSITNVLKKYPTLTQGLRIVKKVSNGKERYVLLYGSFASAALANEAKASLPAEFRTAMARKTSALNKELKPAGQQ